MVPRNQDPNEQTIECAMGQCSEKLKNRHFPQHYAEVHKIKTGRYSCNLCNYKCSYGAECIETHIEEVHTGQEAVVVFNPFSEKNYPRVLFVHTDNCIEARLREKVKVKKSKKGNRGDTGTVLLNMNSNSKAIQKKGTMNSFQAPNGPKAKKSSTSENSVCGSATKRKISTEFSKVVVSQKRRGSSFTAEETVEPSDANASTSGDAQVMAIRDCLLYTSPSPRDLSTSRMPSSA